MSEWDEAKLQEIIQSQRDTIAQEKAAKKRKPLTQTLIYLDDWSDRPEFLHKAGGLITTLFVRNRHIGLSCWVASQKMTSVSLCCRINFRWMVIWRLRSAKEMECVINELSAIYPIKTLLEMYNQAIEDEDYSYWYIDMTQKKPKDMFHVRFEYKQVLE